MRFQLTLILAFLNLIAFGIIYYLEIHDPGRGSARADSRSILGSEVLKANRIEIVGPDIPFGRTLVQEDGTWILTSPVQWRANPNAVDRILKQLVLLRDLASFSIAEVESSGQTLRDYGLDEPSLTLTIEIERRTVELAIGTPSDLPDRFYLFDKTADRIHVIDQELLRAVVVDINDLQDNLLFGFDLFALERFSIEDLFTDGPLVRFLRIGDDWRIESPISTAANSSRVDARLNTILNLPIGRFLVGEAAENANSRLASPELRIIFETEARTVTLLLAEPETQDPENPSILGKFEDNPTTFELPAAPFGGISKAVELFRERSVVQFEVENLDEIQIAGQTRSTTLQRLDNRLWQVVSRTGGAQSEPERFPADPLIIADAMDTLLALRVSEFVNDAPTSDELTDYGLSDPRLQITASSEGQSTSLLIGDLDPQSQLLYARRTGDPFVFKISLQPIRTFPLNPLHYRLRLLNSLPETASLERIALESSETNAPVLEIVRNPDGDGWINVGADLTPDQLSALGAIEEYARDFRVGSYLGRSVGDSISINGRDPLLWTWRFIVDYRLPASDAPTPNRATFWLTDRITGNLQGGAFPDAGMTFTLPVELVEALSPFLVQTPPQAIFDDLESVDRETDTGPLRDLLPDLEE